MYMFIKIGAFRYVKFQPPNHAASYYRWVIEENECMKCLFKGTGPPQAARNVQILYAE